MRTRSITWLILASIYKSEAYMAKNPCGLCATARVGSSINSRNTYDVNHQRIARGKVILHSSPPNDNNEYDVMSNNEDGKNPEIIFLENDDGNGQLPEGLLEEIESGKPSQWAVLKDVRHRSENNNVVRESMKAYSICVLNWGIASLLTVFFLFCRKKKNYRYWASTYLRSFWLRSLHSSWAWMHTLDQGG